MELMDRKMVGSWSEWEKRKSLPPGAAKMGKLVLQYI